MHDIDPRLVIAELLNTVPVDSSGVGRRDPRRRSSPTVAGGSSHTWRRRQPNSLANPGASARDQAAPVPDRCSRPVDRGLFDRTRFLFYVVYLGLLAVGGSYVLTHFGLADLEAGYRVDHRQATSATTSERRTAFSNASSLPKPWLEIYNPTICQCRCRSGLGCVPGLSVRGSHCAADRRGTFHIEPMVSGPATRSGLRGCRDCREANRGDGLSRVVPLPAGASPTPS